MSDQAKAAGRQLPRVLRGRPASRRRATWSPPPPPALAATAAASASARLSSSRVSAAGHAALRRASGRPAAWLRRPTAAGTGRLLWRADAPGAATSRDVCAAAAARRRWDDGERVGPAGRSARPAGLWQLGRFPRGRPADRQQRVRRPPACAATRKQRTRGAAASTASKGPLAEAKQPETAEQAERRREKRKLDEKAREEEKKRKEAHQKEVQKKIEKIPMVTDIEKVSRMLEMGDFVAPYKWECQFPPIPDDPKLIDIPMDIKSLVKFRYDSKTEKEAKYELLTEPDLGITIDLVDPQAYEAPPGATLAPEDAELLSSAAYSAAIGEKGKSATATAKTLRQEVTWLRKTPLLGNNLYDAVHKYQKNPIEAARPSSAADAREIRRADDEL